MGDVVQHPSVEAPDTKPKNGPSGRNGLTAYRLRELERRGGNLEGKVDALTGICTRIETGMKNYVPMEQVNTWIWRLMLVLVGLVVSVFIHILIWTRP